MARRVLGIVGSPRKEGNTHVLVERILEGAREAGATTELVMLGGLTIRECDGCHACWKGKPCTKADDMNGLYRKLAECDVIVFGTPVYWYGPTALMKALIDRLVYFNCPENRPKLAGKSAILAIPFEETDPATAAPVVEFFGRTCDYLGLKVAGKVLAGGVTRRGEVAARAEFMREAFSLGRDLQ